LSASRRVTERRPAKHCLIKYTEFCPSSTNSQSYDPSSDRFTTYPFEFE